MKEKFDVGGMSSHLGIEFIGNKYLSHIDIKKNKVSVGENIFYSSFSILKFIKKIPFIRGIVMVIIALISAVHRYFKKNPMWGFIFVAILFFIIFYPSTPVEQVSKGFFWDNYLLFLFITIIAASIYSVRRNHSIEHKIISAFENGRDLSLEHIKKQSKENRRCGGVLVAWAIIFAIGLRIWVGGDFNMLLDFAIISIAYEFFRLARLKGIIGNIFYAPGFLIQKITTSNNIKDEDILKAREAMIQLLKKEDQEYKL